MAKWENVRERVKKKKYVFIFCFIYKFLINFRWTREPKWESVKLWRRICKNNRLAYLWLTIQWVKQAIFLCIRSSNAVLISKISESEVCRCRLCDEMLNLSLGIRFAIQLVSDHLRIFRLEYIGECGYFLWSCLIMRLYIEYGICSIYNCIIFGFSTGTSVYLLV